MFFFHCLLSSFSISLDGNVKFQSEGDCHKRTWKSKEEIKKKGKKSNTREILNWNQQEQRSTEAQKKKEAALETTPSVITAQRMKTR